VIESVEPFATIFQAQPLADGKLFDGGEVDVIGRIPAQGRTISMRRHPKKRASSEFGNGHRDFPFLAFFPGLAEFGWIQREIPHSAR
jgi:hypothetical protein